MTGQVSIAARSRGHIRAQPPQALTHIKHRIHFKEEIL